MAITSVDKNRRDPVLKRADVTTALPEWFQADNPKFVSFMEAYEEFLDSDGGKYNFHQKTQDLFKARDIPDTDEDFLDEIIGEIGNGLTQSSFFKNPRLMARLLGNFYQQKGTAPSAEGFFRGFFGEEVEVQYPKRDIFLVGTDQIGFDSQKKIQDAERFQVLSILIKSGLSVSDYQDLYKRFVHPAGFHFAGDVTLSGEGLLTPAITLHNPLEEPAADPIFAGTASFATGTLFGEHTGLQDSSDGTTFRIDFRQQELFYYTVDSDLTAADWITYYDDIKTLLNPNSFTLDDSANAGRPDLAMTIETLDNDYFTRISSDSAI